MTHQLLNRKEVFAGRAFTVAQHHLRLPDGRVQTYDLVEHNNAVTILPLDDQGNIIFIRQYRLGAQGDLLELPAGVLHDEEDPTLSASREVREETGFAAGRLSPLGGFYMAPGYSTEYMHVFLATDLTADPLPQDDDEFLQAERIPMARALEMARQGEIRDGKTLVALFLAGPLFSSQV
ncbi:MAG TPA: NUDIX hydrolase [Anaerolinea sp.]|nr:NUDIX hydrolase [Anaerolinea sp.]